MIRLLCLLFGYIFGLFQTGYIVSRLKGIDIRNHGSKNSGTTNILRTMGLKYALIVFAGDVLKCIFAVLIGKALLIDKYPEMLTLLLLYIGTGVILGHNFPFYMNFKGGKGIAATGGFVISLCWQFKYGYVLLILGLITFFGTFFITHYVSLGSILVYVGLIIEVYIFGQMGLLGFPPEMMDRLNKEYYAVILFLAIMAWVKHRENIKRLLQGCERKTYLKSRPEIDVDNMNNDNKNN